MKRSMRALVTGLAGATVAAGLVVASGGAALAATGTLGISPATGTDQDTMVFNYPQPCSGGTNVQVSLSGGNATGTFGLVPNSSQSSYGTDSAGGLSVPAATTISAIAAGNGFSTAGQTYTITGYCQNSLGSVKNDTFTNTITFSSTTNSDGTRPYTTPVTLTTTNIGLSPSTASIDTAHSQVLTATVTPSGATGTVEFDQGSTVLATGVAVNSSGVATYTFSNGTPGTYNVTAKFTGTGTYASSGPSNTSAITVTQAPATNTSQVLTVNGGSSATVQQPNAATFVDTITPSAAPGTVTFLNGSAQIGSVHTAGGTAQLVTSSLPVGGPYTITAHFAPDNTTSYNPSDSNPVTVTVTAAQFTPDNQTIDVVVTAGTLTISTPYDGSDAAHTFHLGTMTLDPTAHFLSANAAFPKAGDAPISVSDTRAGAQPWTASVSSTGLSSGSNSIPASGLGLVGITPTVVSGSSTVTPHPIIPNTQGGVADPAGPGTATGTGIGSSATPFATADHGPGTVTMRGTLWLYASTATPAGTYSGVVVFTIA